MGVSYDKLWKLRKMKKQHHAKAAGFSSYLMGQLNKDAYVSLEVVSTLCQLFHCNIEDVVGIIED